MNKSGIEPRGNKILVEPDKIEETTKGGILIPQSVKDRHQLSACYGEVIAVGADCGKHTVSLTERLFDNSWKEVERTTVGYSEPQAKVGDRISFSMYAGITQTGEDGVEYTLINDEDVISKVSKKVVQTSIEARKAM